MKMIAFQDCDSCKYVDEKWTGEHCDSCTPAHSNYEAKDEYDLVKWMVDIIDGKVKI